MAGESSLFKRAMSAIGDLGVLTPESRAVQNDIMKQRALRYNKFMESVPGAKGVFNLAPNAEPVVKLATGEVRVLPKGANIPEGAQLLNKSHSEIDNIVYNVAKEYDPHVMGAIGAGAVATPAALAYQTATPDQSGREAGPSLDNSYTSPDGVSVYGNAPQIYERTGPLADRAAPMQEAAPAPAPAPVGQAPYQRTGPLADRLPASPAPQASAARQAVAAARQTLAPLPPRRPENVGDGGGDGQSPMSGFARLVSGDFREGADQRIMDAMRRQREESGVDSSTMARGGAAQGKGMNGRDAALHKALEIIHHMLTRR